MFVSKFFRTAGICLMLGLLVAVSAAQAEVRGLIRVMEVPGLYWVDDFGIKHYVPDLRTAHSLFGPSVPISTISAVEYLQMPRGQALNIHTDPLVFNTQRDFLAKMDRIPQGYLRYERIGSEQRIHRLPETSLGAPSIRTGLGSESRVSELRSKKLFDNDTDMGRPLVNPDLELESNLDLEDDDVLLERRTRTEIRTDY